LTRARLHLHPQAISTPKILLLLPPSTPKNLLVLPPSRLDPSKIRFQLISFLFAFYSRIFLMLVESSLLIEAAKQQMLFSKCHASNCVILASIIAAIDLEHSTHKRSRLICLWSTFNFERTSPASVVPTGEQHCAEPNCEYAAVFWLQTRWWLPMKSKEREG